MKTFVLTVCLVVLPWSFYATLGYAGLPPELADAAANGRLLSLHAWTPNPAGNPKLTCAVILPSGHRERDLSTLVIYNGVQRLLAFSPSEFPVSIFPTGRTNVNLATIWESADGSFHLWVFSFSGGTVRQCLHAASKLMPEFVYPDAVPGSLIVSRIELGRLGAGYWSQRIIISNLRWVVDRRSGARSYVPVTADVYVWDGSKYEARNAIPWADRFTAP
jgi:hypothetical protein